VSDPGGVVAGSPSVIEVTGRDDAIAKIIELASREGVAEFVVGYPISLRGEVGPQAAKVSEFAGLLSRASGMNVSLWDERYSTVEARRLLRNLSKKVRKQKEKRDAIAAMLILQSYLDRKTPGAGPSTCDTSGAGPAQS
jgi:putative Holliday junction resolvase